MQEQFLHLLNVSVKQSRVREVMAVRAPLSAAQLRSCQRTESDRCGEGGRPVISLIILFSESYLETVF